MQKPSKKKSLPQEAIVVPVLQLSVFYHIKFSKNQLKFLNTIKKNTITMCTGPAGTAKTFVACYAALDHYVRGECKKIVLFKPAVEAGDPLGFLPGTLQEKIAPYMYSYISNMEKIIGTENLKSLVDKGIIEMKSLSHERGATEDNAFMLLDETQNSELSQIILFVTRMGKDSKIVIAGDTTQYDLYKRRKDFGIFSDIVKDIDNVEKFEFSREDIVRHPILIEITDRYEKYKSENNLE